MRYKSLGVFSGTSTLIHCPGSRHSLRLWLQVRVGYEEVLPPCGHLLELHLPTSAYWHLQFTRGAVNDSCSQERSCGGYCRNQFQPKSTFKKPTVRGKISSHPLRKKKTQSAQGQDIPPPYFITGGMPINTARSQFPSDRMAILTISKQ